MVVIAKTVIGKEYMHSIRDMYEVPKRSAEKIRAIMNREKWNLKDNETWHIYNETLYEPNGRLSIREGVVKLRKYC